MTLTTWPGNVWALVDPDTNGPSRSLLAAATNAPVVQDLRRRLEEGGTLTCAGVSPAAGPFLTVLLHQFFPRRPIVAVVANLKAQEAFYQDLQTWLLLERETGEEKADGRWQKAENRRQEAAGAAPPIGALHSQPTSLNSHLGLPSQLLFYPAWEILPHESRLPHADVISERLETLVGLGDTTKGPPLVVTSVVALMQRTFAPETLRARTRRLERGARCDPLDLIEWLEAQAYEPEAQVTQKGEIALRGGILDVYPPTSPWPVRLEFFGDELESLRHFDPHSQTSKEALTAVFLPPAGELGLLRTLPDAGRAVSLLDYLSSGSLIVLCEPADLDVAAEAYALQVPPADPLFAAWPELLARLEAPGRSCLRLTEAQLELGAPVESAARQLDPAEALAAVPETEGGAVGGDDAGPTMALALPSLESYRPVTERMPEPQIAESQRREFFAQLHRWLRQGYQVHVACNNVGERQRFLEVWEEYGFAMTGGEAGAGGLRPALHLGALTRGFLFEAARLVVVTDAEFFGRYRVQRPRRLKSPHATAARSALEIDFTELEEGDYVVHVQHGIGRYLGLRVLPLAAARQRPASVVDPSPAEGQECLVIEYAPREADQEPPKLYVPVSEAHLVSKYVGAGKARPPLNTLGGGRWAKAKAQAEKAIRDFAGELLAIQAARESQPRPAFGADQPWQREFEASFFYEETPDQQRAIEETKRDLEASRPMDRLICGDVGFGKTEVALRAAFKAVLEGKQVAILVPTTVLAQQHYNTFRERMADYPVRIELLSRFRTRRQQQQVVRALAAGTVDIVIGTHRLVQSDVAFKELGLVVIDEEQRFGVAQKEKFKQLRRLVDVLTLSATPIPRTLYLALTGARDMSTIETPPQDRLPVETIITPYDERVIRDAIQRELNRGGQVFFLHNRVTTIETVAKRLEQLVPQARLGVGHGQMHSDDLETVMTRFVNGETDVLLSTTIIESGIDIPNANTILIDRADRFGLSDLYQLRGRVGRYKHQAYAYFLLPRHAGLVADARKRISAIRQYSSLGSGFKIAMRDLEIRGAGNLLGPEQSGHITAVGFELYCQLLKQSVSALKGERVQPRVSVEVRLDFLALNPGEVDPAPASELEDRRPRALDPADPGPTPPERGGAVGPWAAARPRIARAPAYVPLRYVSDARQRIELYRKLAQATDRAGLDRLEREIRDRFGRLPDAVKRLLEVAELRILASERGIGAVETEGDRLRLSRQGDYLTLGGKFPRLTKPDPAGKLREIRRLLLAL